MYHSLQVTNLGQFLLIHILALRSTAAFTYYYDPVILRNKLTPSSIFRDIALRKRDSKKFMFHFYVFYRVYTNIQNDMDS